MSRIIPVPTTRVGDYFIRQRLIDQVQSDQLSLFELQNKVSTGRRLQLPSDDAPAALRAINLQRLLDRKGQIRTNLQSSNFYLGAAENGLGQVSQQLSDLRAAALGVTDTVSTDTERKAVAQQVDRTLQFLVDTANSKSQGRYLFAGSRSQTQPYEYNGQYVEYKGNQGVLRSYVDLERLFDTNVSGPEVFGGISSAVEGTVDLNPHLTANTLLSTINGGNGIARNAAITVKVDSGGLTESSVVDLSGAVTIGDVIRLIETNSPPGSSITAKISGDGLTLQTDTGTVSVSEVAEGRTARELSLFTGAGTTPSNTLVGTDVNPAVLKTTPLANLLGTKAQGKIASADSNNDIVITSSRNGAAFNGVTVEFVGGGLAGNETANYDSNTKTLTVQIQDGFSTAKQVAAAITAEGTFTATADYHDGTSAVQFGTNPVGVATFTAITDGGGGEVLDTTSGLVITNGGKTETLDISSAETVEDLLNRLNGADLGLLAEINAAGDGINIRSRLSGPDFTIGENGGTTATQLGIRTYTGSTKLADLNRGIGVPVSNTGDDLLITARDGTQLSIDLAGAATIQDVMNRINNHVANNTGTTAVLARLTPTGNGIQLVDSSSVTTGSFSVQTLEGSRAAEFLGFVPSDQAQVSTSVADGDGNFVLASEDRHTLETDSVFNTLSRLRSALEQNDVQGISDAIERLDTDLSRVNFARSEIGARLQSLDVIDTRLQDENVQLKSALSQDLDVDLVEAISNLTGRQYAFEASLRTAANLLQMTLLNFI